MLAALVAALLLCGVPVLADVDVIPAGSAWKYNDSGIDLCTGRAFASSALDDSTWKTGTGEGKVCNTVCTGGAGWADEC